jgi:glycosyltransferase involved in cell wall biosynthesis
VRVTMLVRNPFTNDSRVEKEARCLAAAGFSVTVVAEGRPGLPPREDHVGYRVVRVSQPLAGVRFIRFAAFRARLIRALLRTKPEILHAHDADALDAVAIAARRLGVPYIYDSHELWLEQGRRGRGRLYWSAAMAYYRLVERLCVPPAAAAITVSRPIAEELERRYRRPFLVVPNYPELTPSSRRQIRSLPGAEAIPSDAPIALRLGSLTPGRGIEQLIEAIARVPRMHLVLLGGGPIEGELSSLAARAGVADRLHRIAPVPSDQVVDFAASADVGVSPAIPSSLNDAYSLPNKLFQYMAAGVPVVASDFPQVREIVERSGAGWCVDARDPGAIVRALDEVISDPDAARERGRRGRKAVEERYNWGAAAKGLLRVYQDMSHR